MSLRSKYDIIFYKTYITKIFISISLYNIQIFLTFYLVMLREIQTCIPIFFVIHFSPLFYK